MVKQKQPVDIYGKKLMIIDAVDFGKLKGICQIKARKYIGL